MAAEGRWGSRQCVLALAALLVVALLGRTADAYIIFVESKECLTQHIESGDSITGSFVVVDMDSAWSEDVGGVELLGEQLRSGPCLRLSGSADPHHNGLRMPGVCPEIPGGLYVRPEREKRLMKAAQSFFQGASSLSE